MLSRWSALIVFCTPLLFQRAEQVLAEVAQALQKGDAARLASFFAPQVEIYLGSVPRLYSSLQGRFVLQEFFQSHSPRSFTLLHKGRSEDLIYAIGSYVSQQGRWDVSFFMRFQGDRYLIEQLRFEPVKE
ncbi:MAG: DUF4783 domain-containing protein [Bacteroidia bacterium]|nr:DUF4783 domain-containing protein [Bacteroidia bacterium]MDW8015969.1 DUF4783 domain-containing protein [Bacteroidia bacterium]